MAVTLIRRIEEKPLSIYSDGTYCYVGTSRGRILKITISGGAKEVFKNIRGAQITALCSDATYLYAGDNKGRLHKITIADGTLATLESDLHSPIICIGHNTATRYLGLANGKVLSRA
jgi:hypothetical protein